MADQTQFSRSYDAVSETVAFIREQANFFPRIGIICGSGLNGLANLIEEPIKIDYNAIPNFPTSTVSGHAGKLVFGNLSGQPVVCMQGRFHLYEGYPAWKITFPVRVMHQLGVQLLITTNAVGSLNPKYDVGDVMIIKDHISLPSLAGFNPLVGVQDTRMGNRFVCLTNAYDPDLRELTKRVGNQLGFTFLREGVLSIQAGPSYETVSENRMLRMLNADVVGMSVAPEVVVARQCNMRVLAMSLVTNKSVMEHDSLESVNHEEVLEVGRQRAEHFQLLVAALLKQI